MILALDPSLSCTGVCIMDQDLNVQFITKITTTSKLDEDDRIFKICNDIDTIIKEHKVTGVVLEGQFYCRNAKTTMQLSRLRGAISFVVCNNKLKTTYMQPTTVKMIVAGSGKATKEEVADNIVNRYKDSEWINSLIPFCDKSCKDKNSDIYDSISIALAYYLNK